MPEPTEWTPREYAKRILRLKSIVDDKPAPTSTLDLLDLDRIVLDDFLDAIRHIPERER